MNHCNEVLCQERPAEAPQDQGVPQATLQGTPSSDWLGA